MQGGSYPTPAHYRPLVVRTHCILTWGCCEVHSVVIDFWRYKCTFKQLFSVCNVFFSHLNVSSFNFANLPLIAKIVWLLDGALAMQCFFFHRAPSLVCHHNVCVISIVEITPYSYLFFLLLVTCPLLYSVVSLSLSDSVTLSFILTFSRCMFTACWTSV